MKIFVFVIAVIVLAFWAYPRERVVWNRTIVSRSIPFDSLEQISILSTGFLQSKELRIIAKVSNKEYLDVLLDELKTSAFNRIEETEEHWSCAKENYSEDFDAPMFIEVSKKMGIISVYCFHL